MLEFLVDENVPRSATTILREAGHKAHHVGDVGLTGAPDHFIIARAREEGWIVVTRDLGFGDLLDYPFGTHAGIILIRLPPTFTARQICDTLRAFIGTVEAGMLRKSLTVVEPGRYRVRRRASRLLTANLPAQERSPAGAPPEQS